jgi:hypothetical protein
VSLASHLGIAAGERVCVFNKPASVDLASLHLDSLERATTLLVFLRSLDELDDQSALRAAAMRKGLRVWIAFPKGAKLGSDLSREALREYFRKRRLRASRIVAIDARWSALNCLPFCGRD